MEITVFQRSRVILIKKDYQVVKRIFDVTLCLFALPIIIQIMLICALIILLDDGRPIFFKQLRTGKGGRRFKGYKFRTMVRNAEELKHVYAHLNKLSWPDFKASDDPRITRVGRFLRKTSLDELPQIINVLKGEMSLVGPRPLVMSEMKFSPSWRDARLKVKPGVTGLWQIQGRSDALFHDWIRYDVDYVKNQSWKRASLLP